MKDWFSLLSLTAYSLVVLVSSVSSFSEVAMGSNESVAYLQKRQNQLIAFGGLLAKIGGRSSRKYTLTFAVKDPERLPPLDYGFLTIGSCMPTNAKHTSYTIYILDASKE